MFDIFLLEPGGAALDPQRVIDAVLESGAVRRGIRNTTQLYYRNDDTSVMFQVILAPHVAGLLGEAAVEEEAVYPQEVDEGASEEAAEPGTDEAVEFPLVTLHLPVIRPTFFALEAIELAGRLCSALGLHMEHASVLDEALEAPAAAASGGSAPASVLESWLRSNRKAALAVKDRNSLTVWSARKSRGYWAYARARAALTAELEPGGVQAPPLFLVTHDSSKKTLFVWNQGAPSVIPRTDLVLVRRERVRTGLLRTKRVVEEGIASGEALVEILASSGEVRSVPADLIVWRGGPDASRAVEEKLGALRLEPADSVERTELSNIIDVDLSSDPAEAVS
jgi:hypothetical protein